MRMKAFCGNKLVTPKLRFALGNATSTKTRRTVNVADAPEVFMAPGKLRVSEINPPPHPYASRNMPLCRPRPPTKFHISRSNSRRRLRCAVTLRFLPAVLMFWETTTRTFDFSRRGAVMGILNVTPDSFSDGGQWLDVEAAVAHALEMIAQGAEIIDIGGESTRPGAEPVSVAEELRRVLPIIERLAAQAGHSTRFVLSIDTMKPEVAHAAIRAGASIVNDVGGLRSPEMLNVVKDSAAGVVIMHMQGTPRTMQAAPRYTEVVREIREFFCHALERCLGCGVPAPRIVFDPGFGFGKTLEHNLEILRRLPELAVAERPLLLGVSRKSFLGKATGSESVADRAWPTVALTSLGRESGARIFRVHDVKPNVEALRMTEAIAAC
jgi:dihydropteroate synthase